MSAENSIFTIAMTAILACTAVVYPARADDTAHNRGPIVNLAADGVAHLYLRPEFEIDGSHSKEELVGAFEQVVDRYARANVPYLFLNVCYQRTAYDSAVWDSYWDVKDPDRQVTGWPRRMWLTNRAGVDPFAVCVKRCRQKGISPWMSVRMNDTHYVNDPTRSSTFWQKHPELRRNSGNGGYDFARLEVRQYYLALLEELLRRYDCDGIELDWMRFPSHFRPGHEDQGQQHLNDFMRRAKQLAEKAAKLRGHPVKIAARIPAVPQAGLARGMDGVQWVRQGLADILVLSAVWRPTDTDIPIEQWRELIGPVDHEYLLAAATDLWIQSSPGGRLMRDDLETQRGFTTAMLDRGADLIYLFNHFNTNDFRLKLHAADGRERIRDENHELLETAGRMKAALSGPRRHVLSFHDPAPPDYRPLLPAEISSSRSATCRIYTGPIPEHARVVVRIGLAKSPGLKTAQPATRLNGIECRPVIDLSIPASIPFKPSSGNVVPHVAYVAPRVVQFEAPLESILRGSNRIEVTLKQGPPQKIVWVEVYVDPRNPARN